MPACSVTNYGINLMDDKALGLAAAQPTNKHGITVREDDALGLAAA